MVSRLRPDARGSSSPAIADDTALFLIRDALDRRKELIYGQLHDGKGGHCAIGALWDENPRITLRAALIDEVAAVNDSVPPTATPRERWQKVRSWLRWKLRLLAKRGRP